MYTEYNPDAFSIAMPAICCPWAIRNTKHKEQACSRAAYATDPGACNLQELLDLVW